MEIVNRVKNILVSPKTEWDVIAMETTPSSKTATNYLLPLALIPVVASFIGNAFLGSNGSIMLGIGMAVVSLVTTFLSVYITAFVINALAGNFGSEKNFDKAFALVAYAYTPSLVAGIFYILPVLGIIASLAGLYGLYLLYLGLRPMMKTPEDKTMVYFIISLVCMVVLVGVVSMILTGIVVGIFVTTAAVGM